MPACFLDTTIVVHVAEQTEPQKTKGERFIRANQPAQMPYYALRELLASRVQVLCSAHNRLRAANNPAEAALGVLRIPAIAGRKSQGQMQAIMAAMNGAFESNPSGGRQHVKREVLEDLARRANSLWRRAHRLVAVQNVQSLSCFNDGRITRGSSGELRGPADSFDCVRTERCAAAAYIYDDKNCLAKMVDALHPKNLSKKAADKRENQQRRKALKELQSDGPVKFHKGRCRALGDAYFAAMCPPGAAVLTTNIEDYEPLCRALRKEVKEP